MRLRGERLDELRMRVAERVDGDAGGEIEIALAVGGGEPGALAALEREVDAREGRQKMRGAHGTFLASCERPEMKCAASPGGTLNYSIVGGCTST